MLLADAVCELAKSASSRDCSAEIMARSASTPPVTPNTIAPIHAPGVS